MLFSIGDVTVSKTHDSRPHGAFSASGLEKKKKNTLE